MEENLFLNGFIYLVAAAFAEPLGKKLGVGAVLGYLIIGAIVGPSAFGLVSDKSRRGDALCLIRRRPDALRDWLGD